MRHGGAGWRGGQPLTQREWSDGCAAAAARPVAFVGRPVRGDVVEGAAGGECDAGGHAVLLYQAAHLIAVVSRTTSSPSSNEAKP